MAVTPEPSERISVVIVDDHPLLREAVRLALESSDDIAVAGEARTGAETLSVARSTCPDVIVLDFRLPDLTGAEVIRELRDQGCESAVVILTSFGDSRNIRAAIDSGACAVLTKGATHMDELAEAVRAAAVGENTMSKDALAALMSSVRNETGSPGANVTDREREVWVLVAMGKTNSEIASALFIAERTVKYHISNLLLKTGARTRGELVALAYRSGLMDSET